MGGFGTAWDCIDCLGAGTGLGGFCLDMFEKGLDGFRATLGLIPVGGRFGTSWGDLRGLGAGTGLAADAPDDSDLQSLAEQL